MWHDIQISTTIIYIACQQDIFDYIFVFSKVTMCNCDVAAQWLTNSIGFHSIPSLLSEKFKESVLLSLIRSLDYHVHKRKCLRTFLNVTKVPWMASLCLCLWPGTVCVCVCVCVSVRPAQGRRSLWKVTRMEMTANVV